MLIEDIVSNFNQSTITKVITGDHNKDYEGLLIEIENKTYRSRLAKATPKKEATL